MSLWRRILFLGLLGSGLTLPCTGYSQPSSKGHPPNTSNPFASGVAAQGRITPAGGIIRVAAPAGPQGQPIVGQIMVKVGDWVEAGQLLAVRRDQPLLLAQLDLAEHEKDIATAALAETQAAQARSTAEIQAQLTDLEGRVAITAANARHAADHSRLTLDQARREEVAALAAVAVAQRVQQAAVATATAGVAQAQTQFDALSRNRTTERAIANAQLDQAKANLTRADAESAGQIEQLQAQADLAALRTHQAEVALVKDPAPEDPAQLAPVQAEAQAARASLEALRKVQAAIVAERAADVAAAETRLASAAAGINVARAQRALGEVHAPSAGRVLAIRAHAGELAAPLGLLELGDTRDLFVDALVFIDDIAGVRVGQKTTIVGSALPDEGLIGQVVEVSPIVAGNSLPNLDPTIFSDQPVVMVKVHIDNPAPVANLINAQVTVRFAQ